MANNALPVYHIAFNLLEVKRFVNYYELLDLTKVKNGNKLTKDTYVWTKGMDKWKKAGEIPYLKPLFAEPPELPKELFTIKNRIKYFLYNLFLRRNKI